MQSSIGSSSALGQAYSPVQKQRYDASGYPSPPSSGQTEHPAGQECGEGSSVERRDATRVEVRTVEVCISPRQEATHSLSPPASCDELDDDDEDNDDSEDEYNPNGDSTITAIDRSDTVSSRHDSLAPSSPSTSIATYQRADARYRSPYIDEELPVAPIRDTPRNPFLQGGPADVGHSGPNRDARERQKEILFRERGKMTYVFRGQRVTYADPYTSDSEDDDDGCASSRGGSLMDRLQPKLLFPSIGKAAVRPTSIKRDIVKKSDIIPIASASASASKPTLEMIVDRQRNGYKATKSDQPSHSSLLERINRAGWSDDEEDQQHQGNDESSDEEEEGDLAAPDEDVPQRYVASSVSKQKETNYDDSDDDMVAEEENPFLQPSYNRLSGTFLDRIQQAQVASSALQSRTGVIRATHGGHRFDPYSQHQRAFQNHQVHLRAHYAAARVHQ